MQIGKKRDKTVYELAGGDPAFRRLVNEFYARVERDPVLRPVFPPDLENGKERQFLFLAQYFGGPPRYNEQFGHPRLRMRHFPFTIGITEAQVWLENMLDAIDAAAIPEPARTEMRQYFQRSAPFMVNQGQSASES